VNWYSFVPADTLFFRGGEPMEAGENHDTTTLFPPPISVIMGAVRTAVLKQNQVSFTDYKENKRPDIAEKIGKCGEPYPGTVMGPLFKIQDMVLVPVPANWFEDAPENSPSADENRQITIVQAQQPDTALVKRLGLKSSAGHIQWGKGKHTLRPLDNYWIALSALADSKKTVTAGKELFSLHQLHSLENRTGIHIDLDRKTQDGYLYTAHHIRMHPEVSILWGIGGDIGLEENTILTLGGEQRFGICKAEPGITMPQTDGKKWLSLAPLQVSSTTSEKLIASRKLVYIGGWDLAKKFHKPTEAYYPAGAVFNENVNNACIAFN